jgi:hypothetical protein
MAMHTGTRRKKAANKADKTIPPMRVVPGMGLGYPPVRKLIATTAEKVVKSEAGSKATREYFQLPSDRTSRVPSRSTLRFPRMS